ncbi:2-isopropylmalate synthase [Hydrogenoanaerobacterium sp.]|uniref:2-isopropylmalate synthase n=1 Tax=Hydrogenoanaerobacterium sp. TaxID=2953763 RepID=UPI00289B4B0A|nr:2-isopropylmalate synthase [Hydrogenoanaerobacterium sp.]
MKNFEKYSRAYFMPPETSMRWAQKEYITEAPIWCSVDLRDGNQSLIVPMSLEEKLEFFTFLVKVVGFKEVEIGFPAASDTEYEFCRALIERDLVPDDVTIQVLTQSRPHIIEKTFAALKGAKNAVVHLYNSTSVAQREQVFKKSKKEIIDIAVSGAQMLLEYSQKEGSPYRFEYSPESFTGTEMDFALEICNAVLDVWKPTADKKVIINLPVTVSHSMPHVYASQIEYMCDRLNYRDNIIVSLHPHNDRGCAVADSEMGLLAGAQRIEGTLFGNGERTGNVDIVTLALNMFSQGVDPELNFENLPAITELYEKVTGMKVYDRQPYSGALVFAAFSGSHQDAIAKGMKWREEHDCARWTVPYLPIDPQDVGREYETDVIRINSQSGKGGIGYLLEQKYGYRLPAKMREDFGYTVKGISDQQHKELSPSEVHHIFKEQYVNFFTPIDVVEVHFIQKNGIYAVVTTKVGDEIKEFTGTGNGRLDAVANALKNNLDLNFSLLTYEEHALERGTNSRAVAYVSISIGGNKVSWGAGVHDDIMAASVNALVSAINRAGVCQPVAQV